MFKEGEGNIKGQKKINKIKLHEIPSTVTMTEVQKRSDENDGQLTKLMIDHIKTIKENTAIMEDLKKTLELQAQNTPTK